MANMVFALNTSVAQWLALLVNLNPIPRMLGSEGLLQYRSYQFRQFQRNACTEFVPSINHKRPL